MEWITTIIDAIKNHAYSSIGVMLLGLGLAYLIKILPKLIENKVKAAIEYVFAKGDAADRAWFKATCIWAEAKYGAGSGEQKAQAVVEKILALLPIKYRFLVNDANKARAIELFHKMFDEMEAEIQSAIDKQD